MLSPGLWHYQEMRQTLRNKREGLYRNAPWLFIREPKGSREGCNKRAEDPSQLMLSCGVHMNLENPHTLPGPSFFHKHPSQVSGALTSVSVDFPSLQGRLQPGLCPPPWSHHNEQPHPGLRPGVISRGPFLTPAALQTPCSHPSQIPHCSAPTPAPPWARPRQALRTFGL